eukprot:8806761-Pyramimonas_sp.AAC.1
MAASGAYTHVTQALSHNHNHHHLHHQHHLAKYRGSVGAQTALQRSGGPSTAEPRAVRCSIS